MHWPTMLAWGSTAYPNAVFFLNCWYGAAPHAIGTPYQNLRRMYVL